MFRTILLPIDLSAEASWEKALPAAQRLLDDGGELHVLAVFPDISLVANYFPADFESGAMHDIGEKLTEWVAANAPDATPHVMHGRIYDEIIQAAERLNADAIVMASHRPSVADYLIGPNAARVVQHAKQSVFVVRS